MANVILRHLRSILNFVFRNTTQQNQPSENESVEQDLPNLSYKWFFLSVFLTVISFLIFLINMTYKLVVFLFDTESKDNLTDQILNYLINSPQNSSCQLSNLSCAEYFQHMRNS